MEQNWDTIPDQTQHSFQYFRDSDFKLKYLCLDNIFAAAVARNIEMIEIGWHRAPADTSGLMSGNVQQAKFTMWAVLQLLSAGVGITQRGLLK